MMRLNVVALLPLEFSVDEIVAAGVFEYWTRHLLPLLDDGCSLGVARSTGVAVADSAESLQAALHSSVDGLSLGDLTSFATDRAECILASLQDPQVTALWLYDGGAPVGRDRPEAIRVMAAVVQAVKERRPQFQLLAGVASGREIPVDAPEGLWQKPILGFSYGAAAMAILGIDGVCRPVHCPLAKDLPAYAFYSPDTRMSQLQAVAWALRGELKKVRFPPGLEIHSAPAAAFAGGQAPLQGFVVAGLVQIVHGILTRYMPPGVPVILIVELMDFGDEFELLLDLAKQHAAGTLRLQIVFFGQHTVSNVVRWGQLHEVRQQIMALCPALPLMGGLPIGHGHTNGVVPMGWATVSCDRQTGSTEFEYLVEGPSKQGDHPHFVMVPAGHSSTGQQGQPRPAGAVASAPTPATLQTITAAVPQERAPTAAVAGESAPPHRPGGGSLFPSLLATSLTREPAPSAPHAASLPSGEAASQPDKTVPSEHSPASSTAAAADSAVPQRRLSTPATRHQAALRRISRRSSLPARSVTSQRADAVSQPPTLPRTIPNATTASATPALPTSTAVPPVLMPTVPCIPTASEVTCQYFVGPTTYVMSGEAVSLLQSLTNVAATTPSMLRAPFQPHPSLLANAPAISGVPASGLSPSSLPSSSFFQPPRRLSSPAAFAARSPPRPLQPLSPPLPAPLPGAGGVQNPAVATLPSLPLPAPFPWGTLSGPASYPMMMPPAHPTPLAAQLWPPMPSLGTPLWNPAFPRPLPSSSA